MTSESSASANVHPNAAARTVLMKLYQEHLVSPQLNNFVQARDAAGVEHFADTGFDAQRVHQLLMLLAERDLVRAMGVSYFAISNTAVDAIVRGRLHELLPVPRETTETMKKPSTATELHRAARLLLKHLYGIYLERGDLNWSWSPDPNDSEDLTKLGLSYESATRAFRVLQTKRLVRGVTMRGCTLSDEGLSACEHADALDAALPVSTEASGATTIDAEGKFKIEEVERDLAFVRDADLRAMLLRDFAELRRALDGDLVKASLLLCGSILEAMLFDVVDRRPDVARTYAEKNQKYPGGFSARDFIEVAVAQKLVGERVRGMASSIVDHRDLIHPVAEQRQRATVDAVGAKAMAAFLGVVLYELGIAATTGKIVAYESQ